MVGALRLPLLAVGAYHPRRATVAYYFGVFRDVVGPAVRLRRRGEFRPDLPDRPRRLYGGDLDNQSGLPIPLCLSPARVAAVVGGLVLAVPALRLRGPYFGLVTLVAVLLLQNFIVIFAGVTGGEIGMMVPDVLSIEPTTNYWYALGFHGRLRRDPVRPVALGGRPDPAGERPGRDRGAALGFNVTKHKLAAFCVSALFSGLAGAMLIFYEGTASVDTVVDICVARAGHHRRGARRPPHDPRRRRSAPSS